MSKPILTLKRKNAATPNVEPHTPDILPDLAQERPAPILEQYEYDEFFQERKMERCRGNRRSKHDKHAHLDKYN